MADFTGVEILSSGVTIRGLGSPPSGDRYTSRELEEIASANRELASEVQPAIKLGHDADQRLLSSSGLGGAGWLENLRVRGDRLLADLRGVPESVARLVRAGAYRNRSVELARVRSERTGREYPRVVTALALLGASTPAVRNLGDAVAYASADAEPLRLYEFDAADGAPAFSVDEDERAYADYFRTFFGEEPPPPRPEPSRAFYASEEDRTYRDHYRTRFGEEPAV